MANFDDDDSNHSVNGWIKKEIEDDDYEEFMKQESHEEYPSSERYEELMSLSKEDLVGRILQQEEDIRYLQDIRHGLEKNVEGFSASVTSFKKLLDVMNSTVTSLKDTQQQISSPSGSSNASSAPPRSAGMATPLSTSRSAANAPTSQASHRATPTSIPASNQRSASSMSAMSSNPRSSASTVSVPSNHMSSSNMGSASMSSHQTVTITKQTNVIIKTEIPSPPPSEPMITSSPHISPNVPSVSMPQPNAKNRNEPQSFYTKQQMPSNQGNAAKSFTSSRSITEIANSILPNRQRVRMQSVRGGIAASKAGAQPVRTNMQQQQQQQFQAHPRPTPAQFVGGRGGRGRAVHPQRSAPYPNPTQRQTRQSAAAAATPANNPPGKPRMPAAPANANAQSSGSGDSSVNDLLANISFKVPSGITLSIIPPKSNSDSRTVSSQGAANMPNATKQSPLEASSRADVLHPLHPGNSPLIEEISTSKPSGEKGVSSAGMMNTSCSTSSAKSSMSANFQVEEAEEEDEDCFEEIAFLQPDKKSSPSIEASNQQNTSDGATCNAIVSVESHAKGQNQSNEFWNSGHKSNQNLYQNNAEYMFEEADDFDSDENDSKVYLGEDVSLPREMVDSCIKQGPTPTKLTRNLMKALFPDLRELASGFTEGDATRPTQPSLPPNKVKAIIAMVQRTFPQVNRAAIVMAMNMKCKEAKTILSKANNQAFSSY